MRHVEAASQLESYLHKLPDNDRIDPLLASSCKAMVSETKIAINRQKQLLEVLIMVPQSLYCLPFLLLMKIWTFTTENPELLTSVFPSYLLIVYFYKLLCVCFEFIEKSFN